MREILFRGKSVEDGEWIYGAYYHMTEYYGDPCDKHIIIMSNDDLEDNMMRFEEVYPTSVGQYIGYEDKNGTKIFEDDILERVIIFEIKERFIIGCKGASFTYRSSSLEDQPGNVGVPIDDDEYGISVEQCEVIGNIHDDYNLLLEDEK